MESILLRLPITSYYFLLLPITPSVSSSCLHALNTPSSELPLSAIRLSLLPDPHPLATAMWVIDILALRVGGEKGEDEADTVGCCSLRAEHITMGEENQGPHDLLLEFLGKVSRALCPTLRPLTSHNPYIIPI